MFGYILRERERATLGNVVLLKQYTGICWSVKFHFNIYR